MADDAPSTGFWRTVPGTLTALAGIITALAGLIAALSQADLLPRPAEGREDRPAAIGGRWSARVAYPWGVTQDETFEFRVEGDRVHGTATYLGHPRAIEEGTVSGERVSFSTRVEELLGDERREYRNHYDGLVSARGIQFSLQDTRGTAPVEFTGRRID